MKQQTEQERKTKVATISIAYKEGHEEEGCEFENYELSDKNLDKYSKFLFEKNQDVCHFEWCGNLFGIEYFEGSKKVIEEIKDYLKILCDDLPSNAEILIEWNYWSDNFGLI